MIWMKINYKKLVRNFNSFAEMGQFQARKRRKSQKILKNCVLNENGELEF